MPVRVTVEIAEEDWNDPSFQEVWGQMIEEEIIRVVKVEKKGQKEKR
ncbi:MAG: hypothetical protein HY555_03540 [Euryarchaeota archaeon]|nr:hypothetical protein [Euryarchaeota archaeon]